MKYQRTILMAILSFAGICRGENTNSFGIYLTAELVDARSTAFGKGDWARIRLAKSPIISADDVLAYDFTNHLMMLKPEAIKRLPRPDPSGIPFIVVANGERVYWGVFMSSFSSIPFPVPSIVIDEHWLDTKLPPNTLRDFESVSIDVLEDRPRPPVGRSH